MDKIDISKLTSSEKKIFTDGIYYGIYLTVNARNRACESIDKKLRAEISKLV